MVIEALLKVSIEGLGTNGKTSIFPCGIFQYMKGVNDRPGTPNYDMYQLALKSTSQRLYPNYCNANWNNNEDFVKYDRDIKQNVLNNLSETEYNKLVEFGKSHPNEFARLGLKLNDTDNEIS